VFGIARASGAWHGVCVGLAPSPHGGFGPRPRPSARWWTTSQGGVFADYFQFKDCPAGSTLVATSVDSPAYNSQPKTAVLIITMAQEKAGERDG
jgi:hypothetical protein